MLINFCLKKYGIDKYKRFSKDLIASSFSNKLENLPRIVSEGRFETNQSNLDYQCLTKLITLRNKLLHNKDFLESFEFPEINAIIENGGVFIPVGNSVVDDKGLINFEIVAKYNEIDTLEKELCLSYGRALGVFRKFVLLPALMNEIIANDMVYYANIDR